MKLETFQGLLGASFEDALENAAMQFVLEDVEETILNYCNLKELPPELMNTAYRMALDLYRHEKPGECSSPLAVTSISEGDTSTSFQRASDALAGGILKDYREQLNRYRRLRW